MRLLDVFGNPMSAMSRKSIQLEMVLCQMRNSTVTDIDASSHHFDDEDAIKMAASLQYVLFICIDIVILSIFTEFVLLFISNSINTSLKKLDLSDNNIGDAGAAAIGTVLAYVPLNDSFCPFSIDSLQHDHFIFNCISFY